MNINELGPIFAKAGTQRTQQLDIISRLTPFLFFATNNCTHPPRAFPMHARVSRSLRGMGAEEPTMFVLQLAEDLGERFDVLLAQMKRELLVEITQTLSRFGIVIAAASFNKVTAANI